MHLDKFALGTNGELTPFGVLVYQGPLIPPWDLAVVLKEREGHSFEPLPGRVSNTCGLRVLLVTLTSKQDSDIHAVPVCAAWTQ